MGNIFSKIQFALTYPFHALARFYFVRVKTHDLSRYDVIVCSPGGAATTALIKFLGNFLRVNAPDDRDGLKHLYFPPKLKKGKSAPKFVYLYGDLKSAALSLFRRNLQSRQALKLGAFLPVWEKSIESYARHGQDRLLLKRAVANWANPKNRGYEVLFVRYEDLWESIPAVLTYLGLPEDHEKSFPKFRARKTDQIYAHLGEKTQKDLFSIYGETFLPKSTAIST